MKQSNTPTEIQATMVVPAITAGLVLGVMEVLSLVSYATLIFSGNLTPHLAQGIGLILFGSIVIALVVAVASSFPTSMAASQDSPAAILALVAASITTTLAASGAANAAFPTIVAAIVVTGVGMGAFFFALGTFRLGRFVRYIPYPVIGGFLAGAGWLLFKGGFAVMETMPSTLADLFVLLQPMALLRWVPGVALAVLLVLVLRRWTHPLVIPAIMLGAILIFYVGVALSGSSISQAQEANWMLGPFPSGGLYEFLTWDAVTHANWGVLVTQADKILTILIIGVIGFLLNLGGIELAARRDVDVNHELKVVGAANLLAAVGGGLAGFTLLSTTTLANRLGSRSRLSGITFAAVFLFALLAGAAVLAYFPRPVVGGLLIFSGLSFLVDWLYDAYFHLSRLDYGLILLILAVIVFVGFLPGVGVGIAVAMLLFIINYSRIRVVKNSLTGSSFRSAVERSPSQRERLREQGGQLLILQLQEFIFFGTAQNLLDRVRARLQDTTAEPLHFLILDFQRVSGLDASAISSFLRLAQLTETHHVETFFTDLTPEMCGQLERGGLRNVHFTPTLDAAVERCENQIVAETASPLDAISYSLQAQLVEYLPRREDRDRLERYLERVQVPADTVLIRQGEIADGVYFIEQGSVSVEVALHNERTVRLRMLQSGTVVGEIGVYLGGMRTATVTTLEPTTAYRVITDLSKMQKQDPDLAAAIHRWIATILAERLADEARAIEALMH